MELEIEFIVQEKIKLPKNHYDKDIEKIKSTNISNIRDNYILFIKNKFYYIKQGKSRFLIYNTDGKCIGKLTYTLEEDNIKQLWTGAIHTDYQGQDIMYNVFCTLINNGHILKRALQQTIGTRKLWKRIRKDPRFSYKNGVIWKK